MMHSALYDVVRECNVSIMTRLCAITNPNIQERTMIVAITHTKGGVGKTTTALNLAVGRALKGRNVLAVDGDRQGSLMTALAQRDDRQPSVAVAQYADGPALRQQVTRAAHQYDDIVIDAGGRDNSALRAALLLADVVVVPYQPQSLDVWSLADMEALLTEARAVHDIDARAVLVMSDPRGMDNTAAAAAVPEGVTYLDAPIGRRKPVAELVGQGLSVFDVPKRAPKATDEYTKLLNAVFGS
jgi:chromosome partitioning protein